MPAVGAAAQWVRRGILVLEAAGRLLLCPRARRPQQQQSGWQEMEVHQSQTRHSGARLPQQQTLTWWTLVLSQQRSRRQQRSCRLVWKQRSTADVPPGLASTLRAVAGVAMVVTALPCLGASV